MGSQETLLTSNVRKRTVAVRAPRLLRLRLRKETQGRCTGSWVASLMFKINRICCIYEDTAWPQSQAADVPHFDSYTKLEFVSAFPHTAYDAVRNPTERMATVLFAYILS